ncbi:MAG: hypothetical protein ACOCWR_00870 [Oceanidesulfovibrio sp.]
MLLRHYISVMLHAMASGGWRAKKFNTVVSIGSRRRPLHDRRGLVHYSQGFHLHGDARIFAEQPEGVFEADGKYEEKNIVHRFEGREADTQFPQDDGSQIVHGLKITSGIVENTGAGFLGLQNGTE